MKCAPMSVAAWVLAASSLSVPHAAWAANEAVASKPAGNPVSVTVVAARAQDMAVALKASGVVAPLSSVDVRPQISSVVQKVHFQEGQFVQAGQLLFTLDARAEQANLAKAQAQLAKDQAALADAKRQLERARQLQAQNFVSQGAVDTALAQVEAQQATVAADQAAIDAVKVTLSYAQIRAPRAGRVGVVAVNAGSLVQANQSSLVTITQMDPMGVSFNLPQRHLQDALQGLQKGGTAVQVRLADAGDTFRGKLQFVDSTVDAASGTVKAKAVFANPQLRLWPGAFVEVTQTVSQIKDAVVIPHNSIIQAARGAMVYVVQEGKAVQRPVQVQYAEGGMAAVTGVAVGDKVVQDGKQNLRPNAPVVVRDAGKERAKDSAKDSPAKSGKPVAESTP